MSGKYELKKSITTKIDKIVFNYVRYNHIYEDISQNENISKTTIYTILKTFRFNRYYNDKLKPVEDIIYTDTVYIK